MRSKDAAQEVIEELNQKIKLLESQLDGQTKIRQAYQDAFNMLRESESAWRDIAVRRGQQLESLGKARS